MQKEAINGVGGSRDDLQLGGFAFRVKIAKFEELPTQSDVGVAGFGEDERLLRDKQGASSGEDLGFEAFGIDLDGDDFVGRNGKTIRGEKIVETRDGRRENLD